MSKQKFTTKEGIVVSQTIGFDGQAYYFVSQAEYLAFAEKAKMSFDLRHKFEQGCFICECAAIEQPNGLSEYQGSGIGSCSLSEPGVRNHAHVAMNRAKYSAMVSAGIGIFLEDGTPLCRLNQPVNEDDLSLNERVAARVNAAQAAANSI